MLTFDLLASKVKFASLFVWAIYIYIESIEVTFTQVSEPWPVGLLCWFCQALALTYFVENKRCRIKENIYLDTLLSRVIRIMAFSPYNAGNEEDFSSTFLSTQNSENLL